MEANADIPDINLPQQLHLYRHNMNQSFFVLCEADPPAAMFPDFWENFEPVSLPTAMLDMFHRQVYVWQKTQSRYFLGVVQRRLPDGSFAVAFPPQHGEQPGQP